MPDGGYFYQNDLVEKEMVPGIIFLMRIGVSGVCFECERGLIRSAGVVRRGCPIRSSCWPQAGSRCLKMIPDTISSPLAC